MKKNLPKLEKAISLASQKLLAQASPQGHFEGSLSSSAVSTAVAAFALAKGAGKKNISQDGPLIRRAQKWLATSINEYGGWGDTIESPSNLSATLLARATLFGLGNQTPVIDRALQKSDLWLKQKIGGTEAPDIVKGILNFYGKDLTFSVPLLTICALSGMLGSGKKIWKSIPSLPFELAPLPHQIYHLLRLPLVSYAIPALIAVGITQFKHNPPSFPLTRLVRHLSISPALKKLNRLAPSHGGFLEAAPLTGFVATCLGTAGYADHPVVVKALGFLRDTVRPDGSWPIDTNLSLWLTAQAVKALAPQQRRALRSKLIPYFHQNQFQNIHPFTHAQPGGWGWTHLPGAVPDGDDTAGALVALALLDPKNATAQVYKGILWLLNLANSDGGIPTFCKGWGFLPFDRSCPDISAHALQAFALWLPHVAPSLQSRLRGAMGKILKYLEKSQDQDGAWTPLWFGDQRAKDQTNRVWGTSAVLEGLATLRPASVAHLTRPAVKWLIQSQNGDGGWGGEMGTSSLFETTALALSALSFYPETTEALMLGLEPLLECLCANGLPPSSPIGLYFASLWYDEKLYPLLFGLRACHNLRTRLGLE